MKMKKPLALLLSFVSVCSMAACGGGGGGSGKDFEPDPNAIEIMIVSMAGGVGSEWLYEMEPLAEEWSSTKMYGSHPGFNLSITEKQGISTDSALTGTGYNVLFTERTNVQQFISNNLLLDITDLVTKEDESGRSIEDAIYEDTKARFQDAEGNYYGLPHYEFYSGLSYDVTTFEKYGAFFAAPNQEAQWVTSYSCKYGSAQFTDETGYNSVQRSCGPDGEYNTYDDGLPTSLQEMLILCQYLKDNNVAPMVLSGQHKNMSNYLIAGLWPALAGYAQMQTLYTFNGEIEAIKLDANGNYIFTTEPLFEGVEGIYKPETEMVTITYDNGSRATDMAAKYYALAFLEALMQEGFFDEVSLVGTTSHTGAQKNLIFGSTAQGQKDRGMLIDGSYWWNESVLAGNFEDYAIYDSEERNIRFMSMPTSLNTTTTEGNGEPVTLLDVGQGSCYINANIASDAALVQACKDFLEFAYSDQSLRDFTRITGVVRPMHYTLTDAEKAEMNGYEQALYEMREVGNSILLAGDNEIFRTYTTAFRVNLECEQICPTVNGQYYKGTYNALEVAGVTSRHLMEGTRIAPSQWGAYLDAMK